MNIINVRG